MQTPPRLVPDLEGQALGDGPYGYQDLQERVDTLQIENLHHRLKELRQEVDLVALAINNQNGPEQQAPPKGPDDHSV